MPGETHPGRVRLSVILPTYNEAKNLPVLVPKIVEFFTKHQAPPAPDAEPLLQAALTKAKAEGKAVFVWFSAPW